MHEDIFFVKQVFNLCLVRSKTHELWMLAFFYKNAYPYSSFLSACILMIYKPP